MRKILYLLVGVLLASVLVGASTYLAAQNSTLPAEWERVQRTNPLLWMMDASGYSSEQEELQMLRARLEALENASQNWTADFDAEATRLTQQAFLALGENIEANAKQLETVTTALRYQRAEMQTFRKAVKTGILADEAGTPPALDAPARPHQAVLSEWRAEPEKAAEPVIEAILVAEPVVETVAAIAIELPEVEAEPEAEPDMEEAEIEEDEISAEMVDEPAKSAVIAEEPAPRSIRDSTVNAGATVVGMDYDIAEEERKAASEEDTRRIAAEKAAAAALEFNRSKDKSRSIFRSKR